MNPRATPIAARLLILGLILLTGQPGHAAKYLRVNDSRELFRVEKITLQTNDLRDLSDQFTLLARRQHNGSAAHQRSSGKFIALAMRLYPANREASQINRTLQQGDPKNRPSGEEVIRAILRIQSYQPWLAKKNAGPDANKLSGLISDAISSLSPEADPAADKAEWHSVIQPLDAYKKTEPAPPKPPEPTPEPPPSKPRKATYHIARLSLRMPVSRTPRSKHGGPILTNVQQVTLGINTRDDTTHLEISTRSVESSDAGLRKDLNKLESRLNAQFAKPENKGATAEIRLTGRRYAFDNGQALTAAAELMLRASQAKLPLRQDLHICLSVDAEGKPRLPPNFWESITALRKKKGARGRLLVPPQAAAALTQLIILGDPDFFLHWEIIAVADMEQVLAAATSNTQSEGSKKLAKASELFATIQKLQEKNTAARLAVNSAVRERLSKITALHPGHLSARLLLLQGDNARPRRLSHKGLARIARPIFAEMLHSLPAHGLPSEELLRQVHDRARAQLDPLQRLPEGDDEKLYAEMLNIANDVRSLVSAVRRARSAGEDNYTAMLKAQAALKNTRARCLRMIARLDQATGRPKPPEAVLPGS